MTLEISSGQLQLIYHHAEAVYPEECCGILLGQLVGTAKIVIKTIATINAWGESASLADLQTPTTEIDRTKHSRYVIPPLAIFQAQKRARELDLEIVGFFHSHPDAPAMPSDCDRDRAWEVYSYPIVSVIGGKVSEIKSWVLDTGCKFKLEEIQVVDLALLALDVQIDRLSQLGSDLH